MEFEVKSVKTRERENIKIELVNGINTIKALNGSFTTERWYVFLVQDGGLREELFSAKTEEKADAYIDGIFRGLEISRRNFC